MRWLRFAVLIIIAMVLQAHLINIIAITAANIKPDLLLILLVFFAIYSDISEAIIASFLIGFAADIIGPTMGPQTISFGVFGTALAYLRRIITLKKLHYQSLAIFVTSILTGTLSHFLIRFKGREDQLSGYSILLGSALYSAIIGLFLFLLASWWMGVRKRRIKWY